MVNNLRSGAGSLLLDAYTADEVGARNAANNLDSRFVTGPFPRTGLYKSKFTVVTGTVPGSILEQPQTTIAHGVANRANPRVTTGLRVPQTNIPASLADTHDVWLYLSPSTVRYAGGLGSAPWTQPIHVSIIYAVNYEMNRHGLRSALAGSAGLSAIIQVPGIEPQGNMPRYGVAISDADIRSILQMALRRNAPYTVDVLAAFSTGINGLNQTLLNDLVALGSLKRIIVYDCLYLFSSGSTADALRRAISQARSARILTYKCTTGGNSLTNSNQLAVVIQNPGLIASQGIIDLFYPFPPAYSALITYRSIEGGIAGGIITIPPGSPLADDYAALGAVIPRRGTVVSSRQAYSFGYAGSTPPATTGLTFLEDWSKANKSAIVKFYRHIGSKSRTGTIRDLIWNNFLPGWPGGDGEENHDLLLPDFAWEFLPS